MRGGWFFRLVLGIALLRVLFLPTVPAGAQTIGDAVRPCVIRAEPGMTAARLFAQPGRFDCRVRQTALGAGDFWVISQPLSIGSIDARDVVRSLSVWQRRMTLYARYADGAVYHITLDDQALTRDVQLGAVIQQPLPTRAAPLARLLWHVEGSANLRGIVLGASVATGTEAASANLAIGAIYAAFAGLCFALLIYNLALWRALGYRFLPFYALMLLALLAYAFSSSGALAWVCPTIANTARLRINYLTLAIAGVSALAFIRCFFEERVFAGWLSRLATGVSIAMMVAASAVALLGSWQLPMTDTLYSLAWIALLGSLVPILASAWRRKSAYLSLFALGWSVPIALAAARTAFSFNIMPYSFWIDHSTVLSMGLESLLSSLAIAYRIRLLSIERDEAREQEIAARLLADTDPLTGLLNRRAFLRHAIGREGDQTLLLADIDHFKRVNETIGHDGGDEVLRVFARTLRTAVPPETLVARIGGEEFAIITPADAAVEPDDILALLRGGRMPFDLAVTASIGVSTGPLTRETEWKSLYRRADQALYDAKNAGRDRARRAGDRRAAA